MGTDAGAAGVTAAFVGLLLAAEWKDSTAGRWAAKPAASLGFIAAGWLHGAPPPVLAALVLSALGDVLLIPNSKTAFLAGVGAFLLAHGAYAAAFVGMTVHPATAAAAAAPIAVAALLVARRILPAVESGMKVPIAVYVVVVSAMFAVGVGTRVPLVGVAAGMFWLSDLAVARDQFLAPGFVNRAWGLPLYYGAQLAFALGT